MHTFSIVFFFFSLQNFEAFLCMSITFCYTYICLESLEVGKTMQAQFITCFKDLRVNSTAQSNMIRTMKICYLWSQIVAWKNYTTERNIFQCPVAISETAEDRTKMHIFCEKFTETYAGWSVFNLRHWNLNSDLTLLVLIKNTLI